MGREDTESADVSEGSESAEILDVCTVRVSNGTIANTFSRSGVVCRIDWAENASYTTITVEVDLKRWREIPAGSDEEQSVVDDTLEPYSMGGTCKCVGQLTQAGVCQSCGKSVG